MNQDSILRVLITVDVEIWPHQWQLDPARFSEDFQRYIYGPTADGDYGLPYQLKLLERFGQRAVFLVECLFSYQFGIEPLKEIVAQLQAGKQEVQMHLHPEWIGRMTNSILPGRKERRLREYSLADQHYILARGLEALKDAGAPPIRAFRAGGYGANLDTLRALAQLGVPFDTSYNPCILGDSSGMEVGGPLLQPQRMAGVWEFPITAFHDGPSRHRRHAQLGACSFWELSRMLLQAWKLGWRYFVIVSHGFELLNPAKTHRDPVVVRRFEALLRFLSKHPDKFRTIGFDELDESSDHVVQHVEPLQSHWLRTLHRYGEQAVRRLYG